MVIKQKKYPNQEVVEYTKDELGILINLLILVDIVACLAAIVNFIVGWFLLVDASEDAMMYYIFAIVVALIIIGLVVNRLMRPIYRMIMRHKSKCGHAPAKASLSGWYSQIPYYGTLAAIAIAGGVNVTMIVLLCVLPLEEAMPYTLAMLAIGLASFIVLALWLTTCLSNPRDTPDITIE